jgi:hypothetical protein
MSSRFINRFATPSNRNHFSALSKRNFTGKPNPGIDDYVVRKVWTPRKDYIFLPQSAEIAKLRFDVWVTSGGYSAFRIENGGNVLGYGLPKPLAYKIMPASGINAFGKLLWCLAPILISISLVTYFKPSSNQPEKLRVKGGLYL